MSPVIKSYTFWDYNITYRVAIGVVVVVTLFLRPLYIALHKPLYRRVGVRSGGRCGGMVGDALGVKAFSVLFWLGNAEPGWFRSGVGSDEARGTGSSRSP